MIPWVWVIQLLFQKIQMQIEINKLKLPLVKKKIIILKPIKTKQQLLVELREKGIRNIGELTKAEVEKIYKNFDLYLAQREAEYLARMLPKEIANLEESIRISKEWQGRKETSLEDVFRYEKWIKHDKEKIKNPSCLLLFIVLKKDKAVYEYFFSLKAVRVFKDKLSIC